jgi:hypothetical protein
MATNQNEYHYLFKVVLVGIFIFLSQATHVLASLRSLSDTLMMSSVKFFLPPLGLISGSSLFRSKATKSNSKSGTLQGISDSGPLPVRITEAHMR